MTITVTQLIQAAQLVGVDLGTVPGLDLSTLQGDAVVGEDILSIIAIFWPPAGLIAEALAIAVAVAPFIAATLSPDPHPIADGQTTPTPHSGRNP